MGDRDGKKFYFLDRDGKKFYFLDRDGKKFYFLDRDGKKFCFLDRDEKKLYFLDRDRKKLYILDRDGKKFYFLDTFYLTKMESNVFNLVSNCISKIAFFFQITPVPASQCLYHSAKKYIFSFLLPIIFL